VTPRKPFESFKWRWLSVQPTEGLLAPPVFLGVLRVFSRFEGTPPADQRVLDALADVQAATRTNVDLVRTPDRNLVRNSGQYWKGTGLLLPTNGGIELTALGKSVASGAVSQGEFASIMVQQTVLPNPATYSAVDVAKWRGASLEIRPLLLILQVIDELRSEYGSEQAYLSPNELMKITIPLSGISADLKTHADNLYLYRLGRLNITDWPDCTPGANDKRLAREFMLFLANYGLCSISEEGASVYDYKFSHSELLDENAIRPQDAASIFDEQQNVDNIVASIRDSGLPSIIERQRVTASILSRPNQSKFRQRILSASERRCLLTGEKIQETLEAAHIIPVQYGGSDDEDNGICLRVDIHRLYDSGNIVLYPSGDLHFSAAAESSENYVLLPRRVDIPRYVNPANLDWRVKYC